EAPAHPRATRGGDRPAIEELATTRTALSDRRVREVRRPRVVGERRSDYPATALANRARRRTHGRALRRLRRQRDSRRGNRVARQMSLMKRIRIRDRLTVSPERIVRRHIPHLRIKRQRTPVLVVE